MREKILIADDEESIRFTFSALLNSAGYLTDTANSLSNCLLKLAENTYDLLLLDIWLGKDNGLEALNIIKEAYPDCPVMMITGNPDSKSITRARQSGAVDYLVKPIMPSSLLYNMQKVFSRQTDRPPSTNDH